MRIELAVATVHHSWLWNLLHSAFWPAFWPNFVATLIGALAGGYIAYKLWRLQERRGAEVRADEDAVQRRNIAQQLLNACLRNMMKLDDLSSYTEPNFRVTSELQSDVWHAVRRDANNLLSMELRSRLAAYFEAMAALTRACEAQGNRMTAKWGGLLEESSMENARINEAGIRAVINRIAGEQMSAADDLVRQLTAITSGPSLKLSDGWPS